MVARAEVLAVGDELVHGFSVDTNSAYIARELELVGLSVERFTVVSDDRAALVDAIRAACARADVVVVTGGIGPTEDDRTRAAAAAAAGVELRFDEDSWQHIEQMFAVRNLVPPESNRLQAYTPVGATVLRNDWGTAPGFALDVGCSLLCSLPGVPREMHGMLRERVLPLVRSRCGVVGAMAVHELRVLGLPEAALGERLADLMVAGRQPRVGITASWGVHTVRVVAHAADRVQAQRSCHEVAQEIRARLSRLIVTEGVETLAETAGRRLLETGTSLALAESCTGGMVAAALTDIAGISAVFRAGFVTYSNEAKVRDLDVPAATIERHGAVSTEVAAAMAEGAAARSGADLAVSVTGVAGPGGGTAEKPVGTVCFGLRHRGATQTWRLGIPALGRAFIRHRSAQESLAAICRHLG